MKGRMVPAAAPIRKLRVVGRSRRNAGFRRWKTPVSASLHRGCNRVIYDFAPGRSNHLYSVATVTSATGSVLERWSYNAYGVPTIKNSANATIAKSAVGNDRGFTGYKLDAEAGFFNARARIYSPKLGRFVNRDNFQKNPIFDILTSAVNIRHIGDQYKIFLDNGKASFRATVVTTLHGALLPSALDGYQDGMLLYGAFFIPGKVDPSGQSTWDCAWAITKLTAYVAGLSAGLGVAIGACGTVCAATFGVGCAVCLAGLPMLSIEAGEKLRELTDEVKEKCSDCSSKP